MKAVILAAGRGKRLAPMGWNKPKCLLPFGNQTLLDRIINSLLENGVKELSIVVGYKQELILEAIKRYAMQFNVVVNLDYMTTNTIYSLYLARKYLDENFLYLNSDVLFDGKIIAQLLEHNGNVFAIDEKVCGEEDVKVIVDNNRRIIRIGKALPAKECLGEFIGICRFSRSVCSALVASLCRYNEDVHECNLFFEAAVDDILQEHPFFPLSIGELLAIEIDSPEDYRTAKQLWEPRPIKS